MSRTTALVFDLQNVIVRVNIWQTIAAFYAIPGIINKARVLTRLALYVANLVTKRNPALLSIEHALLKSSDNSAVAQAITLMITPRVLITPTVELLHALHAQGYPLFICSNMGERSFALLQNRYPQLFGAQGLFRAHQISTHANGHLTKYTKTMFSATLAMVYNHAPDVTTVILIDDRTDNLKRASECTNKVLKTHHFTGADRLWAALRLHTHRRVVFDLHGVLFKLNLWSMIRTFLRASCKTKLLIAGCNPWVLYDLFLVWRTGGVVEQFITELPRRYPRFTPCVETLLDIVNAQKPIKATVNALQKLKTTGCDIFVLTNTGERSVQRLATQYPDIFKSIDGILPARKINNYLSKPAPQAYTQYCALFKQRPEELIFVDDNLLNITTACTMGMIAIPCTKPKRAGLLLESLLL